MNKKWREYFLLWSQTEEYASKVMEANRVIEESLKKYKKAYIAYSGGKDSTVLMHLVLRKNENVTVVHWDYGHYYLPRELEKEILDIARKCGAKDIKVLTSSYYEKLGRNAIGILSRHFIGIEIPKLIKEGYDLAFIGLRAEESGKRKRRLRNFYEYDKRGITNVFPIKNWKWKDVWAYIITNNIPYLSYYDKYAPLMGYDRVRFVTLFDPEFRHLGAENIDKYVYWKYYHKNEKN